MRGRGRRARGVPDRPPPGYPDGLATAGPLMTRREQLWGPLATVGPKQGYVSEIWARRPLMFSISL